MSFREATPPQGTEEVLRQIRQSLPEIRFGSIELTIHDGRIVQVEYKRKQRFVDSRGHNVN